jgi:hypothetical protein
LTSSYSNECDAWFRISATTLPRPLRHPANDDFPCFPPKNGEDWKPIPVSSTFRSSNHTSPEDRKHFKNISLYEVELPPTPTRFRDKYTRKYGQNLYGHPKPVDSGGISGLIQERRNQGDHKEIAACHPTELHRKLKSYGMFVGATKLTASDLYFESRFANANGAALADADNDQRQELAETNQDELELQTLLQQQALIQSRIAALTTSDKSRQRPLPKVLKAAPRSSGRRMIDINTHSCQMPCERGSEASRECKSVGSTSMSYVSSSTSKRRKLNLSKCQMFNYESQLARESKRRKIQGDIPTLPPQGQ